MSDGTSAYTIEDGIRTERLMDACPKCSGSVSLKWKHVSTDTVHTLVSCEKCALSTGVFETEYVNPYAVDCWKKIIRVFDDPRRFGYDITVGRSL